MPTQLRLTRDPDGIATLLFDKPDSGANIFDATTLDELETVLDELKENPPKGLVLASAKPKIFIAGADIQAFSKVAGPEAARALSKKGQDLFNRIADLPYPTVAAIHGQALGGGCEIALACDWRMASDTRETRIGLPEIMLGILPGWGGCHRLPRLIGLPAALDIILAGKAIAPYPAKKNGLIDRLVPREHFPRIAAELISQGKRPPAKFRWTDLAPLRFLVGRKATQVLQYKTRGLYPAPAKALEVILAGFGRSREAAMKLEQEGLAALMATPECKNLVRVFFLQERAKKLRVEDAPAGKPAPVRRMAVVGAGVMGAGIAQWHSARGTDVLMRDINPEAVNEGMKKIGAVYAEAVQRHALTRVEARQGMDRLIPMAGGGHLDRVDLIVEAAPEKIELKQKVFAELDARAPAGALLASNTSALSIDAIAGAVRDPGRVVGIHYFNPVHKMQLVEVVRGVRTAPATVARAVTFAQESGKLPVVVKDSPGFLVNRILLPYLVEAGLLFEQGAPLNVIDNALLDFGMPMGPLRLIDEVGADVGLHVAGFLASAFPGHMSVPAVLERMVKDGALGKKSGKGFFLYGGRRGEVTGSNPGAAAWVLGNRHAQTPPGTLRDRMLLLMINECARCLEEGVAASAADVDFAMIFGTGFAPFRGGPLRYADTRGLADVVADLESLAQNDGPRFAPCALLKSRVEHRQAFYPET